MNVYFKSVQHFTFSWSKSSSRHFKYYPKLLIRNYSKNGKPGSGENDTWRKTFFNSQHNNQRPRPNPAQNKPKKVIENAKPESVGNKVVVEDNNVGISTKRPLCAQAIPKSESECVKLPHSCPKPSSVPVEPDRQRKTDNPPTENDCVAFEPSKNLVKHVEENFKSDLKKCENTITKIEPCAPVTSRTSEDLTNKQEPMTRTTINTTIMSSDHSQSGEDGGKGNPKQSRKWLYGLLVVAFGSGAAYYLLRSEEGSEKLSEDQKHLRSKAKTRQARTGTKIPLSSKDLPEKVQYLLVGGGTASFSAFRSIKSFDPKAQVLIVAREPEFPYMRPPLSKDIWHSERAVADNLLFKQWTGNVRSIYFEPEIFYMDPKDLTGSSKGGVAVARGWEVVSIDTTNNQVKLDDGSTITYDKCLLAPGSYPKPLPILENVADNIKEKIYYFRDVFDYKQLSNAVKCGGDVIVIGGGFLGSELSCSLSHAGCKVTQIVQESGVLAKILPTYLSKWLTERVRSEGINVLPGAEVSGVSLNKNKLVFTLANGEKVKGDYCVVAIGAVPDTSLAETSKLETSPQHGGYIVNSQLLAESNLYVAGDAACFYDKRFGRRRVEHHDHAITTGRLAGENMVAPGKSYDHINMLWSELTADIGLEAVGDVDSSYKTSGVFALESPKDNRDTQTEVASVKGEESNKEGSQTSSKPIEQFHKGVVFYLKDEVVVGVLLWNVFNGLQTARKIVKQECKYDDLTELAKLFHIHSDSE